MTPTTDLINAMLDLLAADTATLAPAALGLKVHLTTTAFSESTERELTDFTEATFTGATALVAGPTACQRFKNPATGRECIQLNEPAGGWHWQATVAPGSPQNIYGVYVTDNASAVLYGCARFSSPVVITSIGDAVDVGNIRLECLADPFA